MHVLLLRYITGSCMLHYCSCQVNSQSALRDPREHCSSLTCPLTGAHRGSPTTRNVPPGPVPAVLLLPTAVHRRPNHHIQQLRVTASSTAAYHSRSGFALHTAVVRCSCSARAHDAHTVLQCYCQVQAASIRGAAGAGDGWRPTALHPHRLLGADLHVAQGVCGSSQCLPVCHLAAITSWNTLPQQQADVQMPLCLFILTLIGTRHLNCLSLSAVHPFASFERVSARHVPCYSSTHSMLTCPACTSAARTCCVPPPVPGHLAAVPCGRARGRCRPAREHGALRVQQLRRGGGCTLGCRCG